MKKEKLTVSVIEAGQMLGIGRNLSYEAVKRGEIPSIQIGGKIRVPIQSLNNILNAK